MKPATNRIAAMLVVSLLAVGCSGLGPRALKFNRDQYNMAVQQTSAQELLMNLVRLRYRDTPFFLQVASVSANLTLSGSLGVTGEMPGDAANVVTLEGSVALEESPTMIVHPAPR